MDIDAARQDQESGRVDDLTSAAREGRQVGVDCPDHATPNRDIGPARTGRGDDRPAEYEEIRSCGGDRVRHRPRIAGNWLIAARTAGCPEVSSDLALDAEIVRSKRNLFD
jgi:hypothetical protein